MEYNKNNEIKYHYCKRFEPVETSDNIKPHTNYFNCKHASTIKFLIAVHVFIMFFMIIDMVTG